MSNSRVRKQLEAKETKDKFFNAFKSKADFILNYQMCKAYFKDSGLSILAIVEKILKAKYNLPWQEKIIRKAVWDARGKTDATITIPQFKYEEKVRDILAKYVEKHFDKMVADSKGNSLYPQKLRDIIEKCNS
jgi:hypothetical protein